MGYGFSQKQAYRRAYSMIRRRKFLNQFSDDVFLKQPKGTELSLINQRSGEQFKVFWNKSSSMSNGENFLYPVVNKKDQYGRWETICGSKTIGHAKSVREYIY